jgi:hypothetical protein
MKKTLLILFLVLLFFQFASADSPVKKVYVTSNINPHPPVIDGKLEILFKGFPMRGKYPIKRLHLQSFMLIQAFI